MHRVLALLILSSLRADANSVPVGCYSSLPPATSPMVAGYQQGTGMTVKDCVVFCRNQGHAYAGLSAGTDCSCGDEFGLTNAVTTCTFTCSDGECGGVDAYNVYYVIDLNQNSNRKLKYSANAATFIEARKACVKMDGDVVGRTIKDAAVMTLLQSLVPSSAGNSSKVWVGLRKRDLALEWVDEREPNDANTYVKKQLDYASMWVSNVVGEDCVSLDVMAGKISSLDCSSSLKSFCTFLNVSNASPGEPPMTLTADSAVAEDNKTLALFIVLPIFLICYGGACLLYCVHKILKHCCKRGLYSQHFKLQEKPIPSIAKKNSVFPSPLPITAPMTFPMTPAEEKKLKLLENASREARERKETERPPSSRPASTRSSGKLLPPMSAERPTAPPSSQSGVAGKSINEILRNKMEQQANKKKPKRIIAT